VADLADLAGLLAPLRADPSTAAVLTDFDGTLARIVDDPAEARPVDGAVDALAALAARYATVAVISGRPVSFLRSVLPESLELVGLYGIEWLRGGEIVDHPDVAPWRPVIARAADAAVDELPDDVRVEPKGPLVTLHYRTAPHRAEEVERWATRRALVDGLVAHTGKMSIELTPPLSIDKGTTVRALAAGRRAVCFVGDDIGDLPAFAVLAELRAAGVETAAIAVRSAEAPEEVLAVADAVIDGPAAAVAVLRALLGEGELLGEPVGG
jgi:trehalose 6-phosphate phosphatase